MRCFNFIYALVFSALFISCAQPRQKQSASLEVYSYNDTVKVVPSPKHEKPLPENTGLAYGLVENRKPSDKIEENLMSQIASYNNALLLGDKQNCKHYLYNDAIVYFRKFYVGYDDDEIVTEFFKTISAETTALRKKWNDHGVDFNIIVPSFVRKVTSGENIYIVFNVTSVLKSETVYTYFKNFEKTLAISNDAGKKWTFITINSDTPNILRLHVPETIVDEIMGY